MSRYEKPIKGRKINWMKAAILEAWRVLTVSPYYAQELISGVDRGVELHSYLRMKTVSGIINGMDVQEWNPATDKYIDIKYDITTVTEAKPLIKETLQAAVGLPVDRDVPVIGFIGRLEEQKGSDILVEAISEFMGLNVQMVILVSITTLAFTNVLNSCLMKIFYDREPVRRRWRLRYLNLRRSSQGRRLEWRSSTCRWLI